MNPSLAAQAAGILLERRVSGEQGERLPPECRPQNLCDSLQIQEQVSSLWCERMDDSIGAWKCSLPPRDRVILAPIYTRNIDSVAPVTLWPKGQVARVEPELAFYFDRDFPPRPEPYSAAEVEGALVRCHLALELIQGRYAEPSQCEFIELLADGLFNQGLFVGPEVDMALAASALEFSISVDTHKAPPQVHAGRHPNGNPRAPLHWLVEFLRSHGQGIVAGQAVITGSYAGVLEIPLNTPTRISYQGLGEFEVEFLGKKPLQD